MENSPLTLFLLKCNRQNNDANAQHLGVRIAIISTDYPPMRSSAAVQLQDLAQELVRQGQKPAMIVPAGSSRKPWTTELLDGVEVLRLAAPRMKDVGFSRRAVAEMLMPFAMFYGMLRNGIRFGQWDAVVWYSPPIFFGPLVSILKRSSRCRTYLILRDIFPEWARDLGLLRKGPAYYFLRSVALYQYALADTIGVQTASNSSYLQNWSKLPGRHLEVLQNWLAQAPLSTSSIRIANTPLASRKIFVYVGNMGVAQGMDILIELADNFRHRQDVGFLFVGRGTAVPRLRASVADRGLDNTIFYDEVDSREMPGLLAQCHSGLLALDPRHKTHNIPGKFLTYMRAGLPVLARINPGTDLARIIESECVGFAYVGNSVSELRSLAEKLVDDESERNQMSLNGLALGERMFSPTVAANQILAALSRG